MENGRVASDRGMTTSQVAIVFPALLFFIMLIVQYGLWFHAKQVADTAAAEALQTPTGSAADGHRAAQSFLASSGNLDDVTIDVERDLEQVQIVITGAAPQLVPGFSWNVTASARAPVERFIPEPER